jgi:signal transduction histidine kinase
MGELIQSVLNYSRLSQNEDQMIPTDLNVILENVKADYELQIEEKMPLSRVTHFPSSRSVTSVNQLLVNLIGNSLKFSNRSADNNFFQDVTTR